LATESTSTPIFADGACFGQRLSKLLGCGTASNEIAGGAMLFLA